GIFSKQYQLTALALAVVFLYGGMLWYVFPVNPEISWEGHLSGFFVGFVFAFLFRGNPIERKKYEWEREDYIPENDPFLQQFDDDGNFIGPPKKQENLTQQTSEKEPLSDERKKTVRIVYSFKKNAKDNLE
ncbi:MAG: rhomboid family intramembrane serine protease, partial [Aequorivita vladivostokensis]|nr:rhomboid family intramembrane serine protease [Aequorivita vladivostokensis]